MLDQRLSGVGALGTSSCADSLAPPHTWEAAPCTHRRVSVGYVGRKTRKGPLARKPRHPVHAAHPMGPASAGPAVVHAGQLSSSLPGAWSMALLCMGVASLAGPRLPPRTSLQPPALPPPQARLGSDLGGLAPAAALGRQLARRPAPAVLPSPSPFGSASRAWLVPPRSPRSPGRGSFASPPAVAQGLAHSVGILCPPVKRRKPGAQLWEDPGA